MSSTTFLASSPRLHHRGTIRRRNALIVTKRASMIKAQQGEKEGSESVDENMIVLRMRIKMMKALDSGSGGAPPPSDWKEWETKIFARYHEGVCDSMEMLQSCLTNMRPSVAVGMLALIAISVPFSSSVVVANAVKVAKGLLAGCHVCIDIDF